MFSDDIRWLVWQHVFLHRSREQIAEDTALSLRTIRRVLWCYRRYADVWHPRHYTPLQRGAPPLLDEAAQTRLRQWIDHDSAFALWELKAMIVSALRFVRGGGAVLCDAVRLRCGRVV